MCLGRPVNDETGRNRGDIQKTLIRMYFWHPRTIFQSGYKLNNDSVWNGIKIIISVFRYYCAGHNRSRPPPTDVFRISWLFSGLKPTRDDKYRAWRRWRNRHLTTGRKWAISTPKIIGLCETRLMSGDDNKFGNCQNSFLEKMNGGELKFLFVIRSAEWTWIGEISTLYPFFFSIWIYINCSSIYTGFFYLFT